MSVMTSERAGSTRRCVAMGKSGTNLPGATARKSTFGNAFVPCRSRPSWKSGTSTESLDWSRSPSAVVAVEVEASEAAPESSACSAASALVSAVWVVSDGADSVSRLARSMASWLAASASKSRKMIAECVPSPATWSPPSPSSRRSTSRSSMTVLTCGPTAESGVYLTVRSALPSAVSTPSGEASIDSTCGSGSPPSSAVCASGETADASPRSEALKAMLAANRQTASPTVASFRSCIFLRLMYPSQLVRIGVVRSPAGGRRPAPARWRAGSFRPRRRGGKTGLRRVAR
jgi:hypothetical protein